MIEFIEFNKIPRLSRNCVITEKIDGTNALVLVRPADMDREAVIHGWTDSDGKQWVMMAGSRTRWITPEKDNYGFAKWVKEHAVELQSLGEGRHFGEWWGPGIQRGYGIKEKTFSLFNTSRWTAENPPPPCCKVVPVLFSGIFSSTAVDDALWALSQHGSASSPGFMRPEGVVVFQTAGRCYFKKTIEKDSEPKGLK